MIRPEIRTDNDSKKPGNSHPEENDLESPRKLEDSHIDKELKKKKTYENDEFTINSLSSGVRVTSLQMKDSLKMHVENEEKSTAKFADENLELKKCVNDKPLETEIPHTEKHTKFFKPKERSHHVKSSNKNVIKITR